MIERVIEDWHRHLKGELPGGLDALLADDVVFYSPIVFTPQRGKAITSLYLNAASSTLGGEGGAIGDADVDAGSPDAQPGDKPSATRFRYVKQVLSGNHAVLEFETSIDGKYVNGIDLISCNDAGKITEFKVMIRPLQAINLVHAQMRAMLESMQGGG